MELKVTCKTVRYTVMQLRIPHGGSWNDLIVILQKVAEFNGRGFKLKSDPFIHLFGKILEFEKSELLEQKEESEGMSEEEERLLVARGNYILSDYLKKQTATVLKHEGITILAQLARLTDREARKIKSVGRRRFKEIEQFLKNQGLRFGMPQSFIGAEESRMAKDKSEPKLTPEALEKVLQTRIDDLYADPGMSTRLHNCLKYYNCKTVSDIVGTSARDWRKTPNLGELTMKELVALLGYLGLRLNP